MGGLCFPLLPMTPYGNRPLLARLIERAAQSALLAVRAPQTEPAPASTESMPAAPSPEEPPCFTRKLESGRLSSEQGRPTNVLYERLSDTDVAMIEERIAHSPELAGHYTANQDETTRRHMILAFGIWLGVEAGSKATGLPTAQPPEDIHAMARGPIATAGGLYEADLVVDALASAGVEMSSVRSALDFGCSSGRVVRVLAAAYPDTSWHGCDPNGPAISWASENLPGAKFFLSGDSPPLALADGSIDLAYAISIWSHFAPELGLRWFEEMHRVVRPGGHLVCTTHGLTSVAFYASEALRAAEQSQEIAQALYRSGSWYAPEFGEAGDWGVVNPDWGTSFLTPEWMLAQLTPHWRVLEFASGRNQRNQDVYVLERA
jgi:SAM-dependent methyltransferase